MHLPKHLLAVALLAATAASAQEAKDPNPAVGAPASTPRTAFGPDAFGYQGYDQAEPQCTAQFIDITATGTLVVTGDDAGAPVNLPGPAFNFYGSTFTQLAAATNGYLSTDPADTGGDLSNDCPLPVLPSTGGGARIYPLHDDLVGDVYFQHFPVCPRPSGWGAAEGCYVFQWANMTHFGGGGPFTFEAVLYTTSFGIVFQHGAGNPEAGSGSTTGLQNAPPPTVALNYACNTAASVPAGSAQCIYHPAFPFGSGVGADLAITLTDTPDPVTAGQTISYAAVVTNTGAGAASDVSVTLPLPAGTTFVSSSASAGGTCAGSGPVMCNWAGSTANGATRTATLVVGVPANTAENSLISASATTTSASPDPDPADNTSTAGTGVITAADLVATLTDTPDPAIAGDALSYTATLTNAGPSDAQDAELTLNLPAEVTQGTVTASAGGVCSGTGTITCNWVGVTAPAAVRTVTVATTIAANVAQGTIINADVQVMSATNDPAGGNNVVTVATTVNAAADLSVTLSDSPDPVIAGTQLTYVATVTNGGLSDAQDVSVSLPIPAGTMSFSVGASAGGICTAGDPSVCTWAGATVPGATRTATIVVSVNSGQTAPLSATVTAASATTDPALANNMATAATQVEVQADLGITLTDAPDPVIAGTQLTYTAVVSNAGPSDATGVVVNLPTPTGTSFVSGTVTGGGSCAAGISCSITGSIVPGTSRTVTITVLVAASVLENTVINATASVTAGSPDPNGANNSASTTTNVIARADLGVTLTSSVPEVLINVPVTFTAISSNGGPSDAQDVSVTITLTPDFRYSGHSATGATCTTPQIGTTGAIVCTWAGATAPGATRTLTVVAYSNVEGNTAVNANTMSQTTDLVPGNNNASLSVVVGYPFNEIPTLSQSGLMLLGLLLGLMGFVAVRRQS